MSYTNSTPNLHLPQYIATDKPTYLGDWNASMQTIDTVITATQASASGAQGTASAAQVAAQNAQASANSANTKADTNTRDISDIKDLFNFSNISTTPDPAWEIKDVQAITSSWLNIIRCRLSVSGKFTGNATVVDSATFIRLFSMPKNIFNLEVGNLNSNSTYITACSYAVRRTSDQELIAAAGSIRCYWDGANTNFYLGITTDNYEQYENFLIYDNITIIPIGQVLNVSV